MLEIVWTEVENSDIFMVKIFFCPVKKSYFIVQENNFIIMKALSFLKGKFCDKPALEVSGKSFSRDLSSSKLNYEFSD